MVLITAKSKLINEKSATEYIVTIYLNL